VEYSNPLALMANGKAKLCTAVPEVSVRTGSAVLKADGGTGEATALSLGRLQQTPPSADYSLRVATLPHASGNETIDVKSTPARWTMRLLRARAARGGGTCSHIVFLIRSSSCRWGSTTMAMQEASTRQFYTAWVVGISYKHGSESLRS
jgi:hypothetical protein